jgi:site-specific recombinase XerD
MGDRAARVRVDGPLARYAGRFRAELATRGYAPSSAAGLLQLMAHLSWWLGGHGLDGGDLTPVVVEEFLRDRRAAGYRRWLSTRSLRPLLEHLRGLRVAPGCSPALASEPATGLLAGYRAYLVEERGLAASTVRNYLEVGRRFVSQRDAFGGADLGSLTGAEVSEFVVSECRARSVGSATIVVVGMRALLRYLHLAGITSTGLAGAVSSAASWPASALPQPIDQRQAARLLSACDRRTAVGRRDFAVLTLLLRLGLRAGEVAALELGDVGWRHGEILVRGKGGRVERLPLPVDVGQALAGWLRHGRPRCSSPRVFTTLLAPRQELSRKGVSAIVHRAALRSGVVVTAHRLRHTAASRLLQSGASLPEVGQVLRHASILSTAIYAKVDHAALSAVARPWPAGAR